MAGSYARFTGKTGLVTGAGMGIGAAIARALASEGAAVAVMDHGASAAKQVSAEITDFVIEKPSNCVSGPIPSA